MTMFLSWRRGRLRRSASCGSGVNMYSGWGDGGLQASLMRNLIGLVDMQGDGGKLDALAHKFAQLGKHVPRFVMRTDGYNRLDSWDPLQGADLRARPYHIYERM